MSTPCRRSRNPRFCGLHMQLSIALTVVVTGGTDCSSSTTTDEPRPRATATSDAVPSSGATGRRGEASKVGVLDAYRRFWDVAAGVGRQPEGQWRTRLEPVATDPFLSELLEGLTGQQERGVVDFGVIKLRPTIAALTATRAAVLDCQDASRSGEIDRNTGEVISVGSSRTSFTATLTKDPTGRWKVAQARYLRDPC